MVVPAAQRLALPVVSTDRQPDRIAAATLLQRSPMAATVAGLGRRFAEAGHELALVGGSVRDMMIGRLGHDLDFTTDARPDRTEQLLRGWADAVWDVGKAYGTIGARKGEDIVEITTYRAEAYDPGSRKPAVRYGDVLADDLRRRDFTVNAMAVRLEGPAPEFVDPFGGVADLSARVLRTPALPQDSFGDDPLRMMRAARFAAQLGFTIDAPTFAAMQQMAQRIEIVSAERVQVELTKLLMAPRPRLGLTALVESGLAASVLPELPKLARTADEHNRHKDVYQHTLTVLEQAIELEPRLGDGPDLVNRLAALLHDIGKPRTRRFEPGGKVTFHHHEAVGAKMARKRLTALRYPNDVIDDVSKLVELHLRFHGYGSGEWTDSAVRRYVRDAGPLLSHLHVLTRADCTTRNRRRAEALRRTYDHLEERIAELAQQEELDSMRPDLDGNQIMAALDIPPGPVVGQAYRFLLDLRLERGPLGADAALEALRAWWAARDPSDEVR
jgi:poly(A) polymerase